MAHGLNTVIKSEIECNNKPKNFHAMDKQQSNNNTAPAKPAATKMGSRRIFTPQFKLQVLESYRNDNDCKGNQRATARKYGIHRRQIQKWLQVEQNLRSVVANSVNHHQFHSTSSNMNNNNNNNNRSSKQILLNNNNNHNNNSEMMKIISTTTDTAFTRHRVVVGSSAANTNMHKNSSTNTTKYNMNKTHNNSSNNNNLTNVGGFISPVLSYGCEQPAISFTHPIPHHQHHRNNIVIAGAPTPTNYESTYESSSSSLSSSLQSSPNISHHHHHHYSTITNTYNSNLMINSNGNSSPVHLNYHPYHPAFVSPSMPSNSFHGIIKPEPQLPVPSHLLATPSHYITPTNDYYPPSTPVPPSPSTMNLYNPTISPQQITPRLVDTNLHTHNTLNNNSESAVDLSMPLHQKRIINSNNSNKYVESRTPSPYDAKWVNVNIDESMKNNANDNNCCDAIDLTCKQKRKRSNSMNEDNNVATPPAKMPKLFKPYLLDGDEDSVDEKSETNNNHTYQNNEGGFKKNSIASDDGQQHHRQKDAIIWNNHSAFSQYSDYHHRTSEFSPNSSISYASPPYIMSPYCEVPSSSSSSYTTHHPPQSSPVSGYESSTSSIYSNDESPPTAAYSIAFKLQDVDTNFNTFHPGRNSTMIYA